MTLEQLRQQYEGQGGEEGLGVTFDDYKNWGWQIDDPGNGGGETQDPAAPASSSGGGWGFHNPPNWQPGSQVTNPGQYMEPPPPPPGTTAPPGNMVPPPATTTNPPPTNNNGGGLGTGGANGTIGGNWYSAALNLYQKVNPGAQVNTPAEQNAFNQWMGQVTTQFGVPNAESLPADFDRRYNPGGGQPYPVGSVSPIWTNPGTGGPGSVPSTPGGAATPVAGQNYAQNQNANQSGSFGTTNEAQTAQHQTTGQTTNQTQTGTTQQLTEQQQTNKQTQNQSSTGTTNQQTTGESTTGQTQTQKTGQQVAGTNTSTGTTRTGVEDTLGLSDLVRGQVAGAQGNDKTREAFLTDLVKTGGTSFNSQVDQAVRNSLTGPQMTGAGDSARDRAAGYAAAEVARRNTGERLQAAGQLAGPTAVSQTVASGVPLLGQTQSTTGTQNVNQNMTGFTDLVGSTVNNMKQNVAGSNTNQGTTNTVGTNSMTGSTTGETSQNATGQTSGFSDLAGTNKETSQGNATGASSQSASGLIPQAQQVQTGGGGCIICTAGLHHGLWTNRRVLHRAIKYKIDNIHRFRPAARGYFFLFGPIARLALRCRALSRITMPVAKAVVYEELRISGVDRLPLKPLPWMAHWTWHGLCSGVGRVLPFLSDFVTDKDLVETAKKHNVFFNIPSRK